MYKPYKKIPNRKTLPTKKLNFNEKNEVMLVNITLPRFKIPVTVSNTMLLNTISHNPVRCYSHHVT